MEENRDIARLIIKIILSVAASYIVFQGTEINDFATVCAALMSFGVFYNLCYLYQISLNFTNNYFVAIFVFLLLFSGIIFMFDKFSFILSSISPQSLIGEVIVTIIFTSILLIPFLLNLFHAFKRRVPVKE